MKHSEYYKTVIEYCNNIILKKIKAGIYTIKACKRFLEDIKKTKEEGNLFYFNENKFNEFCEFAEALYIPDTGKRLKLLSWQLFIYANLYGFYYKDNNERRRFRHAYIEVARKNASYPIAFNASNEVAVSNFMEEKISFLDISRIVFEVLQKDWQYEVDEIEAVYDMDRKAREEAEKVIKNLY